MRSEREAVTYLLRQAKDRVLGTALGQDISDEVLLAVVSGEDGDLVWRVALETHVHEDGHCILRLGQILKRVWTEKTCLTT